MPDKIFNPELASPGKVATQRQRRDVSNFLVEILTGVAVVGDMCFFLGGLLLAFHIRFSLPPLKYLKVGPEEITTINYSGNFIFGVFLFALLAARSGLYSSQNMLRLRRISLSLMNTAVYWLLIYLFISLLFYFHPPISRLFVLLATTCGTLWVFAWRYLFNRFLHQEHVSRKLRPRILVVGWNLEAQRLAQSVLQDPSQPYEILGCLPSAHNEYRVQPPGEVPQLGDYGNIEEILKTTHVDIVLIADLDPKTREIIALCEVCDREMIPFKVIPTYFQILLSGLHLETISGVPVLGIARLPMDSVFNRIIKRTIDVVGAIVGLIVSAPLIAIFGYLVYRESPGPVIYRQDRMGRRGELFKIYKIRSMRLDAEKDGAQWATPNDGRRLKIGAFLRKWNIDEVPQFWNVLMGQMSLVGPRPERPELIEDFKDQIRHYNARHNVKPGMTGWAQVHGLRGNTDLHERLRFDLYYLENWTPILDLYIMFMTFYRNKNAY